MEKIILDPSYMQEIFRATPHLIKFPAKKMWIDYDEEADVLYISFHRPQQATDSKMLDDGLLLRYRNDTLVGITIFDASTRTAI